MGRAPNALSSVARDEARPSRGGLPEVSPPRASGRSRTRRHRRWLRSRARGPRRGCAMSTLFDLAIQICRVHAEQYRSPLMRRPEVSALEADCDRADLVVAKIELARDLVNEAIANLEEAAKLSPEAAGSSAESAAELHVVVHDFITGNALY